MRFTFTILCIFSWTVILQATPWDLRQQQQDDLIAHIDSVHQQRSDDATAEGKEHYLVDCEKILKFSF